MHSIQDRKYLFGGLLSALCLLTIVLYSITGITPNRLATEFPIIRTLQEVNYISDPSSKLLFVGDVHGMYDELQTLIKKDLEDTHTTIVLLGDFLVKGPDSTKVADFIIENQDQVKCVLGNNELLVFLSLINNGLHMKDWLKFSTERHFLPKDFAIPSKKHLLVAKDLGYNRLAHIASICSIAIKFEMLLTNETLYGVHAGMLPGDFKSGEKHISSVDAIVDMKYVNKKKWTKTGRDPEDVHNPIRWYKLWDDYANDKITILYGHDASKGLNLRKHTKGLDSGCVKGNKLTSFLYTYIPVAKTYRTSINQLDC